MRPWLFLLCLCFSKSDLKSQLSQCLCLWGSDSEWKLYWCKSLCRRLPCLRSSPGQPQRYQLHPHSSVMSWSYKPKPWQKFTTAQCLKICFDISLRTCEVWRKEAWRMISVVSRSNQIKRLSWLLILDLCQRELCWRVFLLEIPPLQLFLRSFLSAVHCVSMFGSSEARRTAMLSHAVKYNRESLNCRILWNTTCCKILWNATKG